uniref:DUF834 domain-containing protein n=1 Tax=Oryza rufipogon TaxID=4529 RepID=A0A0E0R301_ORYRU
MLDTRPGRATTERERDRASVLRWKGNDGVGGGVCSRVTRNRGGWWKAKGVREMAGTAQEIAQLRPAWMVAVVHLGEASPMAQKFGQRSSGEGDLPVAGGGLA